MLFQQFFKAAGLVSFREYIPYHRGVAIQTPQTKLEWRNCGSKHHVSVFTRSYQAHTPPKEFGVVKRKAHYSNHIIKGQMARKAVLAELAKPVYAPSELGQHREYVCKMRRFSLAGFEGYMQVTCVEYGAYPLDARLGQQLFGLRREVRQR